jgi:hypothetical protein
MTIAKLTKPNTHVNTELADANDVNENDDAVVARINTIIDSLNLSEGTKTSLAERLNVSLNADGTLKAGAATFGGEWINPLLSPLYVDASNFTATGDQTSDIYYVGRRLKIGLAGGSVYSSVTNAGYSAGTGLTTVTIAGAVLTDPISSVEHGIHIPIESGFGSLWAASQVIAGLIEIATQAEVDAGTDAVRVVTPATLKAVSKLFADIAADDGTVVLDPGTDGTDATFAGTAKGSLIDLQIFTTSGTWTKPVGTNSIEVWAVGGGGGGGGTPSTANYVAGSGGGGGAGYKNANSGIGATETVTIGAGGAGGTSGGAGVDGGTTSFGSHATGAGGTGGGAGHPSLRNGGAGGSGTGDIVHNGVAGGPGINIRLGTDTSLMTCSFGGGASGLGFGGGGTPVTATSTAQTGSAAPGWGGGGGGASNGTQASGKNGGAGAGGVVIVKSYS